MAALGALLPLLASKLALPRQLPAPTEGLAHRDDTHSSGLPSTFGV
ncbi:hypothetical protein LJR009_005603 [Bosea sp. LjRoot9]